MNVKELYAHITNHMTAEQALHKILEGQIRTYENYKMGNLQYEEGEAIHPMMLIIMAAQELEWHIAIPNGDDDDEIQGMIVGTEAYVDDKLGKNTMNIETSIN